MNPWLYVPVGYFKTIGNPSTDWMLETEPEPGLSGRRIPWPRGKVVGGSGSINGLVYVRGQPEDFDAWRDAGCVGWGWNDLLPHFRASVAQERGATEFHSTDGPLPISDDRTDFEICKLFVEAAKANGISLNKDCNDGLQEGVGFYQTTTKQGVRSSTASGYLRPALRRRNLRLETRTLCTKLILEHGRAVGVQYLDARGRTRKARADREVVLSAGSVGSPHLLLLSGIGDADHLLEAGVKPEIHLPCVGRNLQDHLRIHNSYESSVATLNGRFNSLSGRFAMGIEYIFARRGPMTMGAAPAFCFTHTRADESRPDVQFNLLPWSSSDPGGGTMHAFSGFTASLCPLRPESRGSIRLKSGDPSVAPAIHANYLATQQDQRCAVDAVRRSRDICNTPPLGDVILREIAPGAGSKSDEEILHFVRRNASTVFHPVGTCRMGTGEDSVVDPNLRVRGVDRLRIVDASIMPSIISGNTNAAVVAIAERASALILGML